MKMGKILTGAWPTPQNVNLPPPPPPSLPHSEGFVVDITISCLGRSKEHYSQSSWSTELWL